jgi:NAD(P)-dependent dehydrogenase (short-subunit alcohol dehydrogenase family)
MALELANDNIRVNLIAPETTDTEQVPLKHIIKPGYEEVANRMLPCNRYGRPEDHAGAAVYLATELSSWITGQEFFVDGGSHNQNIFRRTPEGRWTVMGVVTESASAAD